MRRLLPTLLVCLTLAGCGQPPGTPTAPPANPPAAKKMTRDELRQKVVGLTEDELMKAVGRPRKTTELGDDRYYFYDDLTVDAASGKTDANIQVVIQNGKVVRVNY